MSDSGGVWITGIEAFKRKLGVEAFVFDGLPDDLLDRNRWSIFPERSQALVDERLRRAHSVLPSFLPNAISGGPQPAFDLAGPNSSG